MGLSGEVFREGQPNGGRWRQRGPTEVVLRIEQLVLDGFQARDGWRIAAAIEAELTRLVAERGLPSSLLGAGTVATIETDDFAPRPTDRAEAIGAQVARAVYAGLGQGTTQERPEGSVQ